MARETRDSLGKRVTKARRVDPVAQGPTGTTINPGPRISMFQAKNVGDNPVRINFDADASGNYVELAVGEWMPHPLPISTNADINFRGITGESVIEMFLWTER